MSWKTIGKAAARCIRNDGYEHCLTEGDIYEVNGVEGILPTSPLFEFTGDDQESHAAHQSRFEVITEIKS